MVALCKELERLVVSGNIHHGGHPVLDWHAANASVEIDAAGNKKPSKKKSEAQIDGIVSLLIALSGAMLEEAMSATVTTSVKWL